MSVLQISADRSKRGILFPGTDAYKRQEAYSKQFGELDIIGFSRTSDGAKETRLDGLRTIPTNSPLPLFYFFDALRIARGLQKPDVISVQDPFETGVVGVLLARRFKVPLYVQVHTDFLSPEYGKLSVKNRLRVFIARFVLKRAARIRVVSQRIKEELGALSLDAPITVLPIFADLERMRGAASPSLASRFAKFATRFLVVSRLEREKNIALALLAFAQAAPPDSCLIIVGEGSEHSMLEQLAKRLHVSERVFFEGAHDAASYYSLADLVLVPSRYEGYGLVIVEALAAGKPVLATDVGVAREAGAIVASADHLASALADWFENGPRAGVLKNYPYHDFTQYVSHYCADILTCVAR